MRLIADLVMLSFLTLSVKGQIVKFWDETPEIIRDSATATKDWEYMENMLKNLVNDGMKMLMPLVMSDVQSLNISSTCIRDTIHMIGGVRKLKTWALRFLDSSAKGFEGSITGTAFFYGAYDECIDTVVPNERFGKQKEEVMFTGKYCLLLVKPHMPPMKEEFYMEGEVMDELKGIYERGTILSLAAEYASITYWFGYRIGVCVPSGCSTDDINQLLAKVEDYTRLYVKVKRCEVKEPPKYTPLMIVVMSIYSFSGFTVLLATLADFYFYKSGKTPNSISVQLLLSFSLKSSFRKLMNTSTSSTSLSCLNGIRFITMSWIILGHTFMIPMTHTVGGLFYVKRAVEEDLALQAIVNSFVSVDTFFFLGAFLVGYLTTQHVKINHGNFSVTIYVLHRLFRILPGLTVVILYMFIVELTISGPAAQDTFKSLVDPCKNYWWTNLLFINNFYGFDGCLPHTWYLAADVQLYIASLIILLPLLRWPKVGVSIAVSSIVLSMIGCAIQIYVKNFLPTFGTSSLDLRQIYDLALENYFMPHSHAGPYIIGMLAGYFLAMYPKLKIPKVVVLLGWSFAILCSTLVLYGPYEWAQGRKPTFWETIFYGGCHKTVWALSIAWMVINCATGRGGIVNYILSRKVWIPLGRLTYMAYLVHVVLILNFSATIRNPVFPTHSYAVLIYFGCLVTTYAVAFVASMLVESPLLSLQKLLMPQRSEKTVNENGKNANHALGTVEVLKEKCTQDGKFGALGTVEVLKEKCTQDGKFAALESSKGIENEGFVYKL